MDLINPNLARGVSKQDQLSVALSDDINKACPNRQLAVDSQV